MSMHLYLFGKFLTRLEERQQGAFQVHLNLLEAMIILAWQCNDDISRPL